MQFSTDLRNARADLIESFIGVSPILKIFSGAEPANADAADSGTVLDTFNLPSDWLTTAASGQKSMQGTWTSTNTTAGTASFFRMYTSGGVCKVQGTVGLTGSGADMIASAVAQAQGDSEQITTFTIAEGNA